MNSIVTKICQILQNRPVPDRIESTRQNLHTINRILMRNSENIRKDKNRIKRKRPITDFKYLHLIEPDKN
jgi:hypothetical protein